MGGVALSERDCYQENRQLFAAINQVEAALVPIEEMLGLKEKDDGAKNPPYSDMPSRLDELIDRVAGQGRRLSVVQEALHHLKEAVG